MIKDIFNVEIKSNIFSSYGVMYQKYINKEITEEQWFYFCMKCNEQLMIENEDVLLRLKK